MLKKINNGNINKVTLTFLIFLKVMPNKIHKKITNNLKKCLIYTILNYN